MPEENQDNPKPHVEVFGEEVGSKSEKKEEKSVPEKEKRHWRCHHDSHYCHHHEQGGGIFGLAVFFAGVILLLNSIGTLSWQIWQYIWPFWPVLLVLFGLRIVFGHSFGANGLIFLLTLAILGFIVIYALIHIGSAAVDYIPLKIIDFVNNFKLLNPSI
ncbi:MAG: hypothetical protein PHQ47_03640 [Candidatus Portnoybacteria bacterium]|nr:hypothetical protein [Candidatus Portnoybacteria bacterium]